MAQTRGRHIRHLASRKSKTTRLRETPKQHAQDHRIYNGNRRGLPPIFLRRSRGEKERRPPRTHCTQKEDARKLLPTRKFTPSPGVTPISRQ